MQVLCSVEYGPLFAEISSETTSTPHSLYEDILNMDPRPFL